MIQLKTGIDEAQPSPKTLSRSAAIDISHLPNLSSPNLRIR